MPQQEDGLTPARAIVDGARLTWPCSACGLPVPDGSGYLTVSVVDADARHIAAESVRATTGTPIPVPLGETPSKSYTLHEIMQIPDEVPWHAFHDSCDPDPDSGGYWFAIERIRTLVALVHWTAHLEEKQWLADTNWMDILRGVGSQGGDI